MRANVEYIDFEGRSDGDSVRKILLQIRPRELVRLSLMLSYAKAYEYVPVSDCLFNFSTLPYICAAVQILVHGTAESTRLLQEQLTRLFGTPESAPRSVTGIMPFVACGADSAPAAVRIHAPRVGEVIDATKEGHMVQVRVVSVGSCPEYEYSYLFLYFIYIST